MLNSVMSPLLLVSSATLVHFPLSGFQKKKSKLRGEKILLESESGGDKKVLFFCIVCAGDIKCVCNEKFTTRVWEKVYVWCGLGKIFMQILVWIIWGRWDRGGKVAEEKIDSQLEKIHQVMLCKCEGAKTLRNPSLGET